MSFDLYKKRITGFYEAHRRMPGYKEIMSLCAFKSKNAVYKLINKLVEAGIVQKDGNGRLIPTGLMTEVRVLGSVQAGMPTDAEEEVLDTMSIDDFLIEKREATYMLTVKGDSMIDAGIQEGDLVIVERTQDAKLGDIVVAEVDGQWTMKYLRKKGGAFYLEAANDRYDDIHPEGELSIGGIVRGVVRKYHR
jgi:SOS regulatory protein LexA